MSASSNNPRVEQWDERYRAGEQVLRDPSPLVVQFTQDLKPGAALDLACGAGRNALYLAERGWMVFAVDGSSVAIEHLKARAAGANLALDASVVDLERENFGVPVGAMELVLCCYYLQRNLIPRMKAALRPGGLLILIAHLADPDQPQGTPTRAFPGELRALFHEWRILNYREGEPSESCHRRAVAELVAAKPA